MKRSNKKGFTIVELVIVIAVIAILAAVLIPNISRLVRKANESSDISLAKNMNTLLSMDEIENGKASDMYDVLIALENGGFKLSNLNPRASGNVFAWDKENNQMVYLDKSGNTLFAEKTFEKGNLNITTRDIETISKFEGYSFYMVQNLTGDITLKETSSLDTGEYKLNGTVTCNTTGDVTINGTITKLVVNSTSGTITNYSIADSVEIQQTASNSYHERGQVKNFTIAASMTGKVVFENEAYVEKLTLNNTSGTVEANRAYIKEVEGNAANRVSATEGYILEIGTFEELCSFRDKVNAGASYSGCTVKLTADIDISSRAWTPIGAAYREDIEHKNVFKGTFDGDNHTISGLTNTGFRISPIYKGSNSTTPNSYDEYVFGLFGSVWNATIKNLKMSNVNIDLICDTTNKVLGDSVGAIAGFAAGQTCTIENCHVLSGKISGFDVTAGIIGRVYTKDEGSIKANTAISNCSNAATVTSARRAAGILGYTNHSLNGVSIRNCANKANVTCLNNEVELGISDGNNAKGSYHLSAGIVNSGNENSREKMTGNTNSGTISNQSELSDAGAAKLYYFSTNAVQE